MLGYVYLEAWWAGIGKSEVFSESFEVKEWELVESKVWHKRNY